jgi:hypothetical protein
VRGCGFVEALTCTCLELELPDAKVVILPGQRHTAMIMAPDVLINEVVQFLAS